VSSPERDGSVAVGGVTTKVRDWGGEVGGRTRVRDWGKVVRYQNVTLWVPNIRTITSLREGFGGKSPLC